jgi:hypothetical protein
VRVYDAQTDRNPQKQVAPPVNAIAPGPPGEILDETLLEIDFDISETHVVLEYEHIPEVVPLGEIQHVKMPHKASPRADAYKVGLIGRTRGRIKLDFFVSERSS